jgi:hypothetical protein
LRTGCDRLASELAHVFELDRERAAIDPYVRGVDGDVAGPGALVGCL